MKRFAPTHRPTIADVATLAGVSKTTVSHVLTGNRPVATSTKHRVDDAIRKLGYRPDGVARSMRTRRTHMIALVIPDIANPYYPSLARGLEDGTNHDYRVFICNTDGVPQQEEAFLAEVGDRQADGIVIDSFMMSAHAIRDRVSPHVSVVRIGTTVIDDPGYDTVHADDESGGYDATKLLIDKGHRRIAMIQGPPGAGGKRNDGYTRALADAGLPYLPELAMPSDWTRAGGETAARRLLQLAEPPTAIFGGNDLMALGALAVAADVGRKVPDDLAIVGFDDIDAAVMVTPALTTVSNPAYETGLLAGTLLRERMNRTGIETPRTVTVPCRLIERETA
ncbi:MAG: LacI family DNA-binding transcriptional regulator [Actinomycetota bacterium]